MKTQFRKALGILAPFERDRAAFKAYAENESLPSDDLLQLDFGDALSKQFSNRKRNTTPIHLKSPSKIPTKSLFRRMLPFLASPATVYNQNPDTDDSDREDIHRSIYLSRAYPAAQQFLATTAFFALLTPAESPEALVVKTAWVAAVLASLQRWTIIASLKSSLLQSDFMNVIGHEHMHVLQHLDLESSGTGLDITTRNPFKSIADTAINNKNATINKILAFGQADYLRTDSEIQARLRTILAHGIKRWGRLPVTREEFWAGMIDCGLRAPPHILDIVASSQSPEIRTFYKTGMTQSFLRAARARTDRSTAELNVAEGAHNTPEAKKIFWNITLPYLYGHFLELVGIEHGRKMMGFITTETEDGLSIRETSPHAA